MRTIVLSTLYLLANLTLQAQSPVKGRVLDETGTPLAFVTVRFNDDPGKGVLTDIEGRFSTGEGVKTLTFQYVGYAPLRLDENALGKRIGKPLEIALHPSQDYLPEATIVAGENPADILIRKAVAHRDTNNPEKRATYRCNTYNKIVFDVLPQRAAYEAFMSAHQKSTKRVRKTQKSFENAERQTEERHLFLMESVTERLFRAPQQVQEKVTLNRISGFQNSGLVALANLVQPFSFYGDYLRVLDKNFVNPISPGSTKRYFFHIEDTLFSGRDTVWVISFHPRQGKVFEGLEGVLHLHSHQWAVQNVRAVQADKTSNIQIKIEQAYRQIEGKEGLRHWFPEQLNFELAFEKYPSPMMGIRAAGRSYIEGAVVNPDLPPNAFDPEMPLIIQPNANTRADTAWANWRSIAPLAPKEWRTYRFLDSLGDAKKVDRWMRVFDYLATGLAPLRGNLSLDLGQLLRLNDFEGARLGLGLSTAQSRPLLPQRRLEGAVYGGYGFSDKAWKYGAHALWRIARSSETQFRLGWQRDLLEPGALNELQPAAFVNRRLYARRMDYVTQGTASLSTRLGADWTVQVAIRDQQIRPGYTYAFARGNDQPIAAFHFQEATFYARFAHGEQVRNLMGSRLDALQPWPAIEFGYTRGTGTASYHRFALAAYQSVLVRGWGRVDWRIEAGSVSPDVPYPKLFSLNQTGGGFGAFAVRNTFQAIPDTLLLADRFVNLYYAQEIGHILYRHRYSAPFLTLLQNVSWGELRQPANHRDLGFASLGRPFYEAGLRLDDLLRFNYVNFARIGIGGAVFYRWGALQNPDWQENVTWRLAFRLVL